MKTNLQNKFKLRLLFYLTTCIALYFVVFSFNDFILPVIQSKTIIAPLLAMLIVLCASGLYGNAVSLFFKNTLEKRLNFDSAN